MKANARVVLLVVALILAVIALFLRLSGADTDASRWEIAVPAAFVGMLALLLVSELQSRRGKH